MNTIKKHDELSEFLNRLVLRWFHTLNLRKHLCCCQDFWLFPVCFPGFYFRWTDVLFDIKIKAWLWKWAELSFNELKEARHMEEVEASVMWFVTWQHHFVSQPCRKRLGVCLLYFSNSLIAWLHNCLVSGGVLLWNTVNKVILRWNICVNLWFSLRTSEQVRRLKPELHKIIPLFVNYCFCLCFLIKENKWINK